MPFPHFFFFFFREQTHSFCEGILDGLLFLFLWRHRPMDAAFFFDADAVFPGRHAGPFFSLRSDFFFLPPVRFWKKTFYFLFPVVNTLPTFCVLDILPFSGGDAFPNVWKWRGTPPSEEDLSLPFPLPYFPFPSAVWKYISLLLVLSTISPQSEIAFASLLP